MATPTLLQARSHYLRQRQIVAAAVLAVRRAIRRPEPVREVTATATAFQLLSASASVQAIAAMAEGSNEPRVLPAVFAGVSSLGFPVSEPIIATIDRHAPAPLEPLPQAWWDDATEFMADLEQVIANEVRDAGRSAGQAEIVARPDWTNYVRMLTPPSCPRCAILAGRIYRDLEGFERHPQCDCVHVPVTSWEAAHDAGLISSPQEAFDKGQIRGLSKADEQAIRDGADPAQVVNAHRGMSTASLFGRNVKTTTTGTTRRSAWRKNNPSILVRLRPESIYDIAAGDRAEVLRLLRLHGYIL